MIPHKQVCRQIINPTNSTGDEKVDLQFKVFSDDTSVVKPDSENLHTRTDHQNLNICECEELSAIDGSRKKDTELHQNIENKEKKNNKTKHTLSFIILFLIVHVFYLKH